MSDPYKRFLEGKVRMAESSGFDVPLEAFHPTMKPHQKAVAQWAVRGGRRGIFARFGLGKSIMQLEVGRVILEHAGGHGLITCPLGVRQEFREDAIKVLGWERAPRFIRQTSEIDEPGLYLTNYESVREGKIDPSAFTMASLDEAAVLRSYGSKTYQEFMPLFDPVPYRFVATATPDPNRYKELIHYAGFLGIMDTGQALTRWFQRDSTQANNLTLYPHKEREFWLWVHSWAVFLQRPSDLGFSDEGYDLPEVRVHYHEVKVDLTSDQVDRDGQKKLFRDAALGLQDAAREKRDSMPARIAKMVDILSAEPERHAILWHDLEAERHAIREAVPEAVEVFGSLDLETREQRIIDFSNGRIQYLATKPELSGSGCNFQRHCSMAVFVGIGYQFHDFIQAIHRIVRFLQKEVCDIHIIYAETEREVLTSLRDKWSRHEEKVERMSEIIREHGLNSLSMSQVLTRSIGVDRIEASGDGWLVANNDCVAETRGMADNSVDQIITSIPFSNHYEYTPSYNDFGHTESNEHFWQQMDFLTPELLRILKPGRIYCCHVKDRINFGNVTGAGVPTVSPFHAEALFHGRQHGFDYLGMITVVTDVVRENNQTYRLGWSEQCKDATKMGVGSPEYILLFHKPQSDRSKGYADTPVTKSKADYTRARWQVDAHAFWRSSGNRLLTPEELEGLGPDKLAKVYTDYSLKTIYDYETHVRIGEALDARGALPSTFMSLAPGSNDPSVWHDVNRMRTLNGDQTRKGLQNHVCPLQFDIVDRLIVRFSNPGEIIFDPFGGLMTVPYRAIGLGRKGRASELNHGYFLDGVKYLEAKSREMSMPSLFDTLEDAA
jgi:DNA modification methylase